MESSVSGKVEQFFTAYAPITYAKGDMILRAGDAPLGAYYLQKGLVRQYVISPSGDMFIVHMYKSGSFFPLTWVVNDIPNTFYFEAIEKTDLYRAPKDATITFLKKHPDVAYYTLQRILTGLHGMVTRTEHLVLDDAYTKTALFLLYLSKQFGERSESTVILTPRLVHREIAAWIGTTRETASLQLEALSRKGIITQRGRQIVVTNIDLLEKEVVRTRDID